MGLTSGGGAANAAQSQAANANAQTSAVIKQIKDAYNTPGLQQQYQDYSNNLLAQGTQQVNQQQQINARDLLFANARSGLTGGTEAAGLNTTLGEEYKQGLLSAANNATSATNALQQANQNQEDSLISQAAAGGGTGITGQLISQNQATTLGAAQQGIGAGSLNNLFQGTAQAYTNEQNNAALAALLKNPTGGVYGGNVSSLYGVG
jgi:hypothetical protein